jgi:hypothetical protein
LHLVVPGGLPIRGRVVDERGRSVTDARVEAVPPDGGTVFSARVSADGRFELVHLQAGSFQLQAHDSDRRRRSDWREARAGDDHVLLVVRAVPMLEGRLVRTDHTAVTRFSVNLEPVEARDGKFALPRDDAGDLVVFIGDDGSITMVPPPAPSEVPWEVVAASGPPLRGRITDADTGASLPGVLVTFTDQMLVPAAFFDDPPWTSRSRQDGTFTLGPVSPRPGHLLLERVGYESLEILVPATDVVIEIKMRRR